MTNLTIYVIYDKMAQTIVRVLLFKNLEVAGRFLKQNIEQLGQNIEDYELITIGDINEETLKLDMLTQISKEGLNKTNFTEKDLIQPATKLFQEIKKEYFERRKKIEDQISKSRK